MTLNKPSYLGLLNAIAVAEEAAEPIFGAWADATDDEDLARTLRFVALREGEHGKAFAKRMFELGFEVRRPDPVGPDPATLEVAGSDRTDREKFELLGFGQDQNGPDVFDPMFADKTLDPQTGGLLGRYIAEERDTGRLLAEARRRVAAAEPVGKKAKKAKVKKAKAKKAEKPRKKAKV